MSTLETMPNTVKKISRLPSEQRSPVKTGEIMSHPAEQNNAEAETPRGD